MQGTPKRNTSFVFLAWKASELFVNVGVDMIKLAIRFNLIVACQINPVFWDWITDASARFCKVQ